MILMAINLCNILAEEEGEDEEKTPTWFEEKR